jgi:hypothetical protein
LSLSDVLTAFVALAGIVVAGSLLAAAPRAFSTAFRPPVDVGWPHGVQEDDDATWSWASARGSADDEGRGSEGGASGHEGGADLLAPVDVEPEAAAVELEPVRYAVRSPDRERS